MTQTHPPPLVKRLENRVTGTVHHVVLSEAEEAEKFRRRYHLHLCFISAMTLLTFLSLVSIVSASCLIGVSMSLNALQETLDYAGRF
jgi:hypothetical protein